MSTATAAAQELCKAFLALPPNALASAMFTDDDDAGDAWEVAREISRTGMPTIESVGFATRLRIRADLDGWREGRLISWRVNRAYQIRNIQVAGE